MDSEQPQIIKVSSKRQITIPAHLYKELGFAEHALCVPMGGGLFIAPSRDGSTASVTIPSESAVKTILSESKLPSPAPKSVSEPVANARPVEAEHDSKAAPSAKRPAAKRGVNALFDNEAAPLSFAGEKALSSVLAGERAPRPEPEHTHPDASMGEDGRAAWEAVWNAADEYPAVKRAFLFGPIAKGAYDERQCIDIRLEIGAFASFGLRDLIEFGAIVEQATGKTTNIVSAKVLTDAELAGRIQREKVLVFERN